MKNEQTPHAMNILERATKPPNIVAPQGITAMAAVAPPARPAAPAARVQHPNHRVAKARSAVPRMAMAHTARPPVVIVKKIPPFGGIFYRPNLYVPPT